MSDPAINSKITDPAADKNPGQNKKTHKSRQKYMKANKDEEETTNQVTKDQQTQNAKQHNKNAKTKKGTTKTTTTKSTSSKPQMSKEEQMLREQRKQIISDINEYLNDQYNEPGIRPLPTEEQQERQRANKQNVDQEEEKMADDEVTDEYFQPNDDEFEDDVDNDQIAVKADKTKGKKKNILQPLMHSGVFIPPSVTRQAIADALDEEEEVEDEDQIKENAYYPFQADTDSPYVQNELPGVQNANSGSSFSYFILIMFMIIGSIYYVLQEAIKRRQREEEPEKYDSGGDNLLGERSNGASDQVAKYLGDAQRIAERFARGMLDQIDERGMFNSTGGRNRDDNNARPNVNGNNNQNNEGPILGARPLESLASQSEPILGSTAASNTDDPYGASPSVIVKEKKKKSDKKKELEEIQDDNFDQA